MSSDSFIYMIHRTLKLQYHPALRAILLLELCKLLFEGFSDHICDSLQLCESHDYLCEQGITIISNINHSMYA